jgi:hypothetical protein
MRTAALVALARVQKLRLPTIQINVATAGGQQVNQVASVNVGARASVPRRTGGVK